LRMSSFWNCICISMFFLMLAFIDSAIPIPVIQ
jgi:hypothetical protein